MKRTLSVNGFDTEVFFSDREVEEILRPLLRCLTQKYEEEGRRQIAFMAGPPAAGKSTLALFLQELSREEGFAPVQALGMDGFHYPNAYLDTHTVKRGEEEILLRRIKGSPETYNTPDMEAVLHRIRSDFLSGKPCGVRWPSYDRNLHDVVPDTYPITGAVLLIEGNYLLLDEPVWERLRSYADTTIMLRAREGDLRERLISRKVRGGMAREAAVLWYENTDRGNIQTVLNRSVKADFEIPLIL